MGLGIRTEDSGFRFWVSGFRIQGSGCEGWGVECRVSNFDVRVQGFAFRVSCFVFRVSYFVFLVSHVVSRISYFVFRISGFVFRGYHSSEEGTRCLFFSYHSCIEKLPCALCAAYLDARFGFRVQGSPVILHGTHFCDPAWDCVPRAWQCTCSNARGEWGRVTRLRAGWPYGEVSRGERVALGTDLRLWEPTQSRISPSIRR